MASPLTPTSYAILGLLGLRSWTTYELAQQMGRALGQFWPRAESKLYEEPKKLVAHGLARAAPGTVGRRSRTVYTITPKGRRALRAWLATPAEADGPAFEFEHLIRVFFAEHGTRDDLLATLASLDAWVEQRARLGVVICREYLRGEGAFPERLPWLIVTGRFLIEVPLAVARWAEWAEETVRNWPDDIRTAEPDRDQLEAMAEECEALLRRIHERRAAAGADG